MIRTCLGKINVATPITAHGLRRACGTHLLKHGANPIHIQMLFGHASLHHLSQYLRVDFYELRAMHERSILGQ
jgi:site-specific recombinase XerD